MVDPRDITNFELSDRELEEVLLFWVLAAGKNGTRAAKCLDQLMIKTGGYILGPFRAFYIIVSNEDYYISNKRYQERLQKNKNVEDWLEFVGTGCQHHKGRTIRELVEAELDLRTCTLDDLESIYGIGKKTSRCFLMHSRQGVKCAGLDTHVLKFLRMMGVDSVPKVTPSSNKEYLRLEEAFLKFAEGCKRTPADLDLTIWNEFAV